MGRPNLIALAGKCEAAEEGSERLSRCVLIACGVKHVEEPDREFWLLNHRPWNLLDVTTSIDAIDLLTRKLLPDPYLHVRHIGPGWIVTLWDQTAMVTLPTSPCATEPLARCAALLRALAERGE